jgi:hypothetical protein
VPASRRIADPTIVRVGYRGPELGASAFAYENLNSGYRYPGPSCLLIVSPWFCICTATGISATRLRLLPALIYHRDKTPNTEHIDNANWLSTAPDRRREPVIHNPE